MKLLICVSEYPPYTSGAGNVVHNTVKYFKKAGHECIVCSPVGPDVKICDESLIKMFQNIRILNYLYTVIYYWYNAQRYVEQNTKNFDALILHNINPLFSWNKAFGKIRMFVTFHTTYFGYWHKLNNIKILGTYYKYMMKLEQKILINMNNRALFIGVSQATCGELCSQGVDKTNIRCISNGVDINRFKPNQSKIKLKVQLGLPADKILFLSIGRLTAQKNLFKLLEVFKTVQTYREDIVLLIAGTGELLQNLQLFVKNNNLENIKFLGYISEHDLPNLYASCDYFIISSQYEGQPLTLLEAMASGLPCIISNIPNLEVVTTADCGIVVNFDNPREATEKILQYIMSEFPSIHSNNARIFAENNLSWESVSKKYLKELLYSGDKL